MKKLLCLSLIAVSALLMSSCQTEPLRPTVTLTISDRLVTGTSNPVTIKVVDNSAASPTVDVSVMNVSNHSNLALALPGKNTEYSGMLYFSTVAADDSTILVADSGLITITYKDVSNTGDRIDSLIWHP